MPSRILYYQNIVKAERSGKSKTRFSHLTNAEPHPVLSKYSESRAQRQMKTKFSKGKLSEKETGRLWNFFSGKKKKRKRYFFLFLRSKK